MNPADVVNGDDEQFTLLLARYSEALRAGSDADPAADPALSAEMRHRLQGDLDCLRCLLQFRPQHTSPEAVTKVLSTGITLHDGIVGKQMGRFQILRPLGHGGGGIVFLAFDPDLRREVALKVPHLTALLSPELRRRFLREARAAAQLDHPNLVPVYEVGESNGVCFLVSPYCRGGSLAEWLAARTEPVPVRQAAEWLAALAYALWYVHANGIYHRDIKPGNILLDPRVEHSLRDCDPIRGASRLPSSKGEQTFTPRLSDFGLAKLHDAQTESTRSGAVLGTVSYMAPEQVEGHTGAIGPATDVYGLGAVLYQVLTGQLPFRGATDTDTLRQVLAEEPAPPRRLRREVPPDLQTICLKCLEKEPTRRYGSAVELADDLRRFLAGEPIRARPLRRSERLCKWVRRRPARAVLLASSLLTALVLVVGWFQLESLEQARDADRAAAAKQSEENQKAAREKEQRLRRHRYAQDMAQAWRSWENRRREDLRNLLDKYRPAVEQDLAEDVRGFEWYFLSRLAGTRPLIMHHPAAVTCLAFSPDGTACASGHGDGALVLWDPASGRKLGILEGHTKSLASLAYSPDGSYLASESDREREVLLWDVRTRKGRSVFAESVGRFVSLGFSPDGRTLATTVHRDESSGEVRLWEMPSGSLRLSLPFPQGRPFSTAFSSDSTLLVIALESGKTLLCDAVTGQVLSAYSGHPSQVRSMACGHKNAIFASGGSDGRVRLCSLRSGVSVMAEYRHEAEVLGVALSPDDRSVASISSNMLKVWDCENRCEHFSRMLHGPGRSVAFSPDGKSLAVGTDYGRLWIYDVFRSANGRMAINDDFPPAESLWWLGHCDGKEPREAWAIAFSPDGNALASAGDDHTIHLWDPATGRELAILRGHQSLVTSLSFSPGGKLLASGSFDKKAPVKLWEVARGEEIATLNGHHDRVDSVAFSPDGKLLASAGRDRFTRLWDVATRTELPILSSQWLDSPSKYVESLAFSPDGRTLAVASNDRAPFLCDVQEQKLLRTLPPHPLGHVAVAFSPDGKTLGTGSREGMVRFFDAATGELRISARGHSDVVNCLAFSPDGQTLASAGFDKKVKLWQVSTGRELLTLPEQKDRVRWLAFSPDGTMLATAGHDGILKIYRADKTELRP